MNQLYPETFLARSSMKRAAYLVLGWVSVACGFVGAFLPLMPTTCFLLLALWAFSRSSPRFHHWLSYHPRFGAPLRAWREHRIIPARAKFMAVGTMSLSATYLVFASAIAWPYVALAISLMAAIALMICRANSALTEKH